MRPLLPALVIVILVAAPVTAHAIDFVSLVAARDSVESVIAGAVDLSDSSYNLTVEATRFQYWYASAAADGWAFHIVDDDTVGCPNNLIGSALIATGWTQKYDYASNGTDGTAFGLVAGHYLCVIQAQGGGGDNPDESPSGCAVTVTVVLNREDDVASP